MYKNIRNAAAALIATIALTVPISAQTTTSPQSATSPLAAAASKVRIDNFGVVNANYLRGAQPTGQDFADLKHLGVKLVIDLAKEGATSEAAAVERAGMKFVRIPLTTGAAPSAAVIEQFLKLVNDPANQPVYVHCMGGKHRTGAMPAVYRMTEDGITADQAFKEMKDFHFGADFLHPELKAFVYSFYSELTNKSGK